MAALYPGAGHGQLSAALRAEVVQERSLGRECRLAVAATVHSLRGAAPVHRVPGHRVPAAHEAPRPARRAGRYRGLGQPRHEQHSRGVALLESARRRAGPGRLADSAEAREPDRRPRFVPVVALADHRLAGRRAVDRAVASGPRHPAAAVLLVAAAVVPERQVGAVPRAEATPGAAKYPLAAARAFKNLQGLEESPTD